MNLNTNIYTGYLYGYPHKTAYRKADKPISLIPYFESANKENAGLYFHIPFCNRKCGYCNLFSQQGFNNELINSYISTLDLQSKQLANFTKDFNFSDFAIGGGTPLVLNTRQLERLFNIAANNFGVNAANVFTSIETSPEEASLDKLNLLKSAGVSRISIGIQSFEEHELKALKRFTDINIIKNALWQIAQINFDEFNIDLIYGIDGQTVESFLQSISESLTYNPSEMFLYPLYVREGTLLSKNADYTLMQLMYEASRELLLNKGYKQTSMRRFTKTSLTDQEYSCGFETVISCGCGGRSYLDNLHFSEDYSVKQAKISTIISNYIQKTDFTNAQHHFLLNTDEQKRRYIIKNLLYYKGINIADYLKKYQSNIKTDFGKVLDNVSDFVEITDESIVLKPDALKYSDFIGQQFISYEVNELMKN